MKSSEPRYVVTPTEATDYRTRSILRVEEEGKESKEGKRLTGVEEEGGKLKEEKRLTLGVVTPDTVLVYG